MKLKTRARNDHAVTCSLSYHSHYPVFAHVYRSESHAIRAHMSAQLRNLHYKHFCLAMIMLLSLVTCSARVHETTILEVANILQISFSTRLVF